MLVRYKRINVKPAGVYLTVPFEARKSHTLAMKAQKVLLSPFGELPDRDAILYCNADPDNFEIVKDAECSDEVQGVELHDDKPAPKKRGRKSKAEMAAMQQGA
jgi:hypothetical protein